MIFLDRVVELCQSQRITKNRLLIDLELNKSSFFDWERRGTIPGGDVIAKIADYFHVSTDYLLGRTDRKEEKPTPRDGDGLSATQAELLGKFVRLTAGEQREVLAFMDFKLSQRPPLSSGQGQEAM